MLGAPSTGWSDCIIKMLQVIFKKLLLPFATHLQHLAFTVQCLCLNHYYYFDDQRVLIPRWYIG